MNNRSYAILNIELARTGAGEGGPRARDLLDLSRPDLDFVKLAEGMGVPGVAVETADEALVAALDTLGRVGKIRSCADQVRKHASTIGTEAESLLTELNRLLAQARTALAGAIPRERDDVA